MEKQVMACPSKNGALQVIGTQLCDKDKNPVVLRGLSSIGVGWYPEYINGEAFREFHQDWHVSVIRLAMYTCEDSGYCTDGNKEELKRVIKEGVRLAKENDMYVIVDWHILSDYNPHMHKDEAIAFFEEMSAEFAHYDHVLYEICNEPNGDTTWEEITAYAEEVIPVIRKNHKDAVVIVGTPRWCQVVGDAAKAPITKYHNLMYALHFYAATHKEWLREDMVKAIEAGLPVIVSEYGICDASGDGILDLEQSEEWIRLMNEYGVSHCAWNISHKNEASAMFAPTCSKTSGWQEEDLSACGKWMYEMHRRWNERDDFS